MKSKLFGATLMVAMMVAPTFAQDDAAGKKKRGQRGQQNVAMQLLKQLEKANLSDEQVAKVKELGKTVTGKMKSLRDEAGITPELVKKRVEAQKSLKDSGKKGKELAAAINKTAGYTEAQSEAMKKVTEARTAFNKQVVALLTDEQKENLPQSLKRAAGAGAGEKAKTRKKKQDN